MYSASVAFLRVRRINIETKKKSFLITPIANLNIFISATSISSICFFVTVTVSSPYNIAGLTTELYTFPFTLAGNLLSQITPDTFLHPFYPACTLFFTSLSQQSLSCTVDPKYLNSFTPRTFVSSIFTVSSSFPLFMRRYSVLFGRHFLVVIISSSSFRQFVVSSSIYAQIFGLIRSDKCVIIINPK